MNPICNICNKEMKSNVSMSHHIMKFHKMSTKEYYDKYIKKDNEGICECGNITTFLTIPAGYTLFCSRTCSNRSSKSKLKSKETCIKNYGVDSPYKCKIIRDKGNETCLKKYGVTNPLKSKDIQNKIKNTCIIKYGSVCSLQSEDVIRKSKETCLRNHGVSEWPKSKECRKLSRLRRINEIEIQKFHGEPMFPNVGVMARQCLDNIQNHIGMNIIREKQIIGYFADGYIPELNLIIEFDEPFHMNQNIHNRDIIRMNDLIHEGYSVFRISQSDWEKDQNQVKFDLLNFINAKD